MWLYLYKCSNPSCDALVIKDKIIPLQDRMHCYDNYNGWSQLNLVGKIEAINCQ